MKRNRILLVALALVMALAVAIPVLAASTVTESDWLEAPANALVKCPGGDCDHTSCDYVYSFAIVGDIQYITEFLHPTNMETFRKLENAFILLRFVKIWTIVYTNIPSR